MNYPNLLYSVSMLNLLKVIVCKVCGLFILISFIYEIHRKLIKSRIKMFEARLVSSGTLKKVLDSIKDLLNEATFDCSDSGIQVCKLDWMFLLYIH